MGSLILCHRTKAVQPYELVRLHKRIYTIEELCYYLCNHLYLVDYTIMNEQLCAWLEEELHLRELAETLRRSMKRHGSLEPFVLTILKSTRLYTAAEITRLESILDKLKDQKEVEKRKYKGDTLFESGELEAAILVYHSIIHDERDDSVDDKFYGKVYACMAAAYGRLFLYEEAASIYRKAYQICQDDSLIKAYIYCCRNFMNPMEYHEFLLKNSMFMEIEQELAIYLESVDRTEEEVHDEELLETWKEQYRKNEDA